MPKVEHTKYRFPKDAYIGDPGRPFDSLGWVRSTVTFTSLDPDHNEDTLCKNYFNKGVEDVLKRAREHGGDAVVDVKSVVFLADGRQETYPRAECSDDGAEGEVLVEGIAVKWKPATQGSAAAAPEATPQSP